MKLSSVQKKLLTLMADGHRLNENSHGEVELAMPGYEFWPRQYRTVDKLHKLKLIEFVPRPAYHDGHFVLTDSGKQMAKKLKGGAQ